MPLRGALWKKIHEMDDKGETAPIRDTAKPEVVLKEPATTEGNVCVRIGAVYHGGHSGFSIEYPPFDMMHLGSLEITDKELVFTYSAHTLSMHVAKVDLKRLDDEIEEEEKKARLTRNFDISIHFDDNGRVESPQFNIPNVNDALLLKDWVQEKLGKKPTPSPEIKQAAEMVLDKKERPTEAVSRKSAGQEDDPLRLLKLRFVRGDISLEEYQRMKKALEE